MSVNRQHLSGELLDTFKRAMGEDCDLAAPSESDDYGDELKNVPAHLHIPLNILVPAGAKTAKDLKKNADRWMPTEENYCKALCGPQYGSIESAQFRVQFVAWRKRETNRKRAELKKSDPFLSPEYRAHLKSPEHALMVKMKIAEKCGLCAICAEPAVECHHNRYRPETWGTPEEMRDMIPVCRNCHDVCDRRRQSAEAKRRGEK